MAHHYALAICRVTANFPKQETYGLAAQMRRAAVSAAANIAEGFGKRNKAGTVHEYRRGLDRREALLLDFDQ
jgi:four helix bundle protein